MSSRQLRDDIHLRIRQLETVVNSQTLSDKEEQDISLKLQSLLSEYAIIERIKRMDSDGGGKMKFPELYAVLYHVSWINRDKKATEQAFKEIEAFSPAMLARWRDYKNRQDQISRDLAVRSA